MDSPFLSFINMNTKQGKVELLAPAGNYEAFEGCLCAGADAIYLAGNRFGARAYADNFSQEELVRCIRTAHFYGKKVYLTVNTLIKTSEFSDLYGFIKPVYCAGLDGVIVQDYGVLSYLRKAFPLLELHASTQMTITGSDGASYLKAKGVSRVVPARELSLAEIAKIKEETGLELECFIHGALCYCYSGQCLFSSVLGGRSGNRGRCAQPCRLPYLLDDTTQYEKVSRSDNHKKKHTISRNVPDKRQNTKVSGKRHRMPQTAEQYPLSLKDLCTIDLIPALLEAGIDSFKIEGRMKRAEYACGVTAIYRKAIDSYYQNGQIDLSAEDRTLLMNLYLRSQKCEGYYKQHNGSDMVSLDSPAYSACPQEILTELHDRFLTAEGRKSSPYYAPVPVQMDLHLIAGQEAVCIARFEDDKQTVHEISVLGDLVLPAQNSPLQEADVKKQMQRLGGTNFCLSEDNFTLMMPEPVFYPVKALNALRRSLVLAMEAEMIHARGLVYERVCQDAAMTGRETEPQSRTFEEMPGSLAVSLISQGQLEAILPYSDELDSIYLDENLILDSLSAKDGILDSLMHKLFAKNDNTYLVLAPVRRLRDTQIREKLTAFMQDHPQLQGAMVRCLEDLHWLKRLISTGILPKDFEIRADYSLYVWNPESYLFLKNDISRFSMPLELSKKEQYDFFRDIQAHNISLPFRPEKKVYGHIPLMISANCVQKTCRKCLRGSGISIDHLIDRTNRSIPVLIDCRHCLNQILNQVPLSLHQDLDRLQQQYVCRLDFTVEDRAQTKEILSFFQGLCRGKWDKGAKPSYAYTNGYEKNGVE